MCGLSRRAAWNLSTNLRFRFGVAITAALVGWRASFLGGLFSSQGAPDRHDVATATAELVDKPSGTRPDRVTVGLDFGAVAANEAIQPI